MNLKKNRSYTKSATLLFASLMFVAIVAAQEAGPGSFDLSWNTIDGGGGTSTGGTFELSGTIGQPDASSVAMTGGTFELAGGFWPGATPVPVDPCPADITNDGLVNVNDLLQVINNWGPCPIPPATCPADITGDDVVNVNDLLQVINNWGLCP